MRKEYGTYLGATSLSWLRGVDLNHRPLGYEPNELPDCSTPQKNHNSVVQHGQTCWRLVDEQIAAKLVDSCSQGLSSSVRMHERFRTPSLSLSHTAGPLEFLR